VAVGSPALGTRVQASTPGNNPTVKGDVDTRAIYVVDSGSVNDVKLYVDKKVDTVAEVRLGGCSGHNI